MSAVFSEVSASKKDEVSRANKARLALAAAAVYPSRSLDDDEGFAVREQGQRATLPGFLCRLSRTDLAAVYELVNLLALNPRDDEAVFAAVARQDARCREEMGVEVDEVIEAEIEF